MVSGVVIFCLVSMVFIVGEFVTEPSWDKLRKCKKADLVALAKHYDIPMVSSLRK